MIVKASSITNLTDARYFSSFGVDLFGFCFDTKAEEFIEIEKAKEIAGWLLEPNLVGEFRGRSNDEINDIVSLLDLKYCQINYNELLANDFKLSVPIIGVIPFEEFTTAANLTKNLNSIATECEHIIIDFSSANVKWKSVEMARTISTAALDSCLKDYSILLDINDSTEKISSIIEELSPAGFNIRGGHEKTTGLKDFELLDEIMLLLKPEV